ncbi:uncharacterized protein LOC143031575 [Oratosquilla oratoria]|uniref:uncharacterized protein LOC143031575 n=1 Tax=Oratosquilla oratoria TaxID=337810 RepID=UPI003F762C9A
MHNSLLQFSKSLVSKRDETTVDLVQAFHQIPVYPDNIPKTAITTPFGLYEPCKRGQSIKHAWCPEADKAFASTKTALDTVATLSFPAPEAFTSIATDASNDGIGAVLQQYVDSRQFNIFTDHKPLTTTFHANKASYIPTQLRHLQYISQSTDNRYVQGTDNAPADALSRNINSISPQSPVIDYAAITAAQANWNDLQRRLDNPSLKMDKIQVPGTDIRLYADVSTGNLRPFLPPSLRHQLFRHLHDSAHPGIRASQRMLRSKLIWPSINKDVRHWARTCLQSTYTSISSVSSHTPTALSTCLLVSTASLVGQRRFPFLTSTPTPLHGAFVDNWVACFGVPTNLTSDRSSQFESTLWNKVMSLLDIRRYCTASYHPQANRMVERFHRQLKAALYAHALNNELWSVALSLVLLGIRTSLKVDIGHSPAELVFGTTLSNVATCATAVVSP